MKTTVPFVFDRSRCMKIGTHFSATALLHRVQMIVSEETSTLSGAHDPDVIELRVVQTLHHS